MKIKVKVIYNFYAKFISETTDQIKDWHVSDYFSILNSSVNNCFIVKIKSKSLIYFWRFVENWEVVRYPDFFYSNGMFHFFRIFWVPGNCSMTTERSRSLRKAWISSASIKRSQLNRWAALEGLTEVWNKGTTSTRPLTTCPRQLVPDNLSPTTSPLTAGPLTAGPRQLVPWQLVPYNSKKTTSPLTTGPL